MFRSFSRQSIRAAKRSGLQNVISCLACDRQKEKCASASSSSKKPTKETLISPTADDLCPTGSKVSIIGAGGVGIACAISILLKRITNHVVLIDENEKIVKGEVLDLQNGSRFLNDAIIEGGKDYKLLAQSDVIMVTAGARQKEGESRLSLVQRNAEIMTKIVQKIVKASPDSIMLLITNPVDIMTYIAMKVSSWPPHRVIGSGTSLDSTRFRGFIAERMGVAPSSCHAWIIGEHGDSSVPVWSGINLAGTRLAELNPQMGDPEGDPEEWHTIHTKAVRAAYDIIKWKGYTSWGIALAATDIVAAIMQNTNRIIAVSTPVKGMYGVDKDVVLSLPCVLNSSGIAAVLKPALTSCEIEKFQESANVVHKIQSGVKF